MRIDKKQKKKEIVLKIIVTFGLVKILIEVTTMSNKTKRYFLPEEEIPHYWYNIQADMVNKPIFKNCWHSSACHPDVLRYPNFLK